MAKKKKLKKERLNKVSGGVKSVPRDSGVLMPAVPMATQRAEIGPRITVPIKPRVK